MLAHELFRLLTNLGEKLTKEEAKSLMKKIYFSAAHILSRKGMNGMNPSSSAGSQSSFIKDLASSLVLGVLAGLVHGEDLGLGQHLLALFLGSSDLLDGLEGGVEVAGSDEVSGVEGIDLAISLEVIDIESEFDGVDLLLLKTKFSHCYLMLVF